MLNRCLADVNTFTDQYENDRNSKGGSWLVFLVFIHKPVWCWHYYIVSLTMHTKTATQAVKGTTTKSKGVHVLELSSSWTSARQELLEIIITLQRCDNGQAIPINFIKNLYCTWRLLSTKALRGLGRSLSCSRSWLSSGAWWRHARGVKYVASINCPQEDFHVVKVRTRQQVLLLKVAIKVVQHHFLWESGNKSTWDNEMIQSSVHKQVIISHTSAFNWAAVFSCTVTQCASTNCIPTVFNIMCTQWVRLRITHQLHMIPLHSCTLEHYNKDEQAVSVGGYFTEHVGELHKTFLQRVEI